MPCISSHDPLVQQTGLRLFAETGDPKKLGVENVTRVRRILVQLGAATSPEDMNLPGYRVHELSGSRIGTHAVQASGNHRITFHWDAPDVTNVDLEGYH